jgi:cell surface protein SprA
LHLGNVSEDILKDGFMQYENGLPTPSFVYNYGSSNWGIQPKQPPIFMHFQVKEQTELCRIWDMTV